MSNLQNEMNKDWLDMVLAKSLEKWNEKNRENKSAEDFVEFTKEIADIYFMD